MLLLARSSKTAFCVDSIYGITVFGYYSPRLRCHKLSHARHGMQLTSHDLKLTQNMAY